jgi:hypothetical protein
VNAKRIYRLNCEEVLSLRSQSRKKLTSPAVHGSLRRRRTASRDGHLISHAVSRQFSKRKFFAGMRREMESMPSIPHRSNAVRKMLSLSRPRGLLTLMGNHRRSVKVFLIRMSAGTGSAPALRCNLARVAGLRFTSRMLRSLVPPRESEHPRRRHRSAVKRRSSGRVPLGSPVGSPSAAPGASCAKTTRFLPFMGRFCIDCVPTRLLREELSVCNASDAPVTSTDCSKLPSCNWTSWRKRSAIARLTKRNGPGLKLGEVAFMP